MALPVSKLGGCLLFALLAGGCSCSRTGPAATVTAPAAHPFDQAPKKSEQLDVHFYIDASVPMKGFLAVAPAKETNYFLEVIDKADGALEGKVTHWRFGGGTPVAVTDRMKFLAPGPYTEAETRIDQVFKHERPVNPNHKQLVVVLTDLFQKDSDITRISAELNERYLKEPDKAVGVMGVRSVFKGKIEDLGENGILPVGGADSLPFYLLLAGESEDVRQAMKKIAEAAKLPKERTFDVFFSRRLAASLTRLITLLEPYPRGVTNEGLLPGPAGRTYPQFGIVQGVQDPNPRFKEFPDAAAGESRYFTPGETRVSVCLFTASECKKDDSATAAVKYDGKGLTIERAQLTKGAKYLIELTAFAKKKGFDGLKPYYIATVSEAREIVANKGFEATKQGDRPGRTPNLQQFLDTLADKLFQSEVPLQRVCLYMLAK